VCCDKQGEAYKSIVEREEFEKMVIPESCATDQD
jgi:hypothetical protein